MTRLFFAAILFLNAAFAFSPKTEACPDGKKHYRATLRHIESGGIGYEDGYTTLEMFFAADPSRRNVTPFFDARAHVFDNGKWAANIGAGLRGLCDNRAYGINGYYDYRNVGHFHSNQIGAGLETLGKLWDVRINGYLPVGNKRGASSNVVFGTFLGNELIISQTYKTAMKGADAEFGIHFGKSKSFDFYAAAGPYYFIGEGTGPTWGGKARISGVYKDILGLEFSDSYDRTFNNKFQGQISLNYSFGSRSKIKPNGRTCKMASALNDRMLQPVGRQEIIVVDKVRKNALAMNPATGLPYFFVFVDNTSSSAGTYESPYPTFAEAQAASSPYDIIYVFPGDGTTAGMNAGIALKANQKLWGSGVSHELQTSAGAITLPAQSGSSPTITNTDVDTEGNAVTLAFRNAVSGVIIDSPINDAIYGINLQNLEVSDCIFEGVQTFPIEAAFEENSSISITNNQFLNNTNGIFLNLIGAATVNCSDNQFEGQISVSNAPIEIAADNSSFTTYIQKNVFSNNTAGSIRFNLGNIGIADLIVSNNTFTNNGSGSQGSLASNFTIISTATTNLCSILLQENNFSGNASNSLYLHTTGLFNHLQAAISENVMSNNGGSALVFATPLNQLTLQATDNTISNCLDNGIAIISAGSSVTGNITIANNVITDIGNASNGIAFTQDFAALNLTLLNNQIERCEGTGILHYSPTGTNTLLVNIENNTISNCENLSSNAASGLDLEQYTDLSGSIKNNSLSGNTGTGVVVGSTLPNPAVCLTFTGNHSSSDYLLMNPVDGTFNLAPCDANTKNTGIINTSGTINAVQSCPDATACPP